MTATLTITCRAKHQSHDAINQFTVANGSKRNGVFCHHTTLTELKAFECAEGRNQNQTHCHNGYECVFEVFHITSEDMNFSYKHSFIQHVHDQSLIVCRESQIICVRNG